MTKDHDRFRQARLVTIIGALANLLLGFIKLIAGVLYQSNALVADGIHSLSDLLTDLMVLLASKYGSQQADASHPYGHQRIETAATLILGLILILAGVGIAWESLYDIAQHQQDIPGILAIPVVLLSIFMNEGLFHYTFYVGKRIHSKLIIANAWHHRSDAASSIIVLISILGSISGIPYLDAIAAIIIALMIIKMGIAYGWSSVTELIDTAVDPATLSEIKHIIERVDGVIKIHQLRSRSMGKDVYVDVHILVSPHISVSEGHYIAQQVQTSLLKRIEKVRDVTVHVDPEDDEIVCPSLHLPNRNSLEQSLLLKWRQACPAIQSWVIHYLDGKIFIDLICESEFTQWQALSTHISQDLSQQPDLKEVRLFQAAPDPYAIVNW